MTSGRVLSKMVAEDMGYVVSGYAQQIGAAAALDIYTAMAQMAMEVSNRTSKSVAAFADAVRDRIPEVQPLLAAANAQIARAAQEAILDTYLEGLKNTPVYRLSAINERNKRYAGGALARVLADPGFVTSDENGVYIGNLTMLDDQARQWARLNYGAGANAGPGAEEYTVKISDITDAFQLQEPGTVRPGFSIPTGYWINGEFYPASEVDGSSNGLGLTLPGNIGHTRGGNSYLLGRQRFTRQQTRFTQGIRGTHFLGAGIRVLAEQIGDAYSAVFKELWETGSTAMRVALQETYGLSRPAAFNSQVSGVTSRSGAERL